MKAIQNVARVEWIKTINYKTFITIIALHAILFTLVCFVSSSIEIHFQGVLVSKLFQFPHVWNTVAWVASWFNILLGLLAIILVTNEFQFRTFRKQLIDGMQRDELLVGKVMLMVAISLYTMILVFLTGLVFGLVNTTIFTMSDMIQGLSLIPTFFLQALSYMLFAMLFAFLLGNTALSTVSFILYFFPIEPIIRMILPSSISSFLPAKIISNLTPTPDFFGISFGDRIDLPLTLPQLPLLVTATIVFFYCLFFTALTRIYIQKKNF